jgi:hypothetical protein
MLVRPDRFPVLVCASSGRSTPHMGRVLLSRLEGYVAPLSSECFFPLAFGPLGNIEGVIPYPDEGLPPRIQGQRNSRRETGRGHADVLEDMSAMQEHRTYVSSCCIHQRILSGSTTSMSISAQFVPQTPPAPFLTSSRFQPDLTDSGCRTGGSRSLREATGCIITHRSCRQ